MSIYEGVPEHVRVIGGMSACGWMGMDMRVYKQDLKLIVMYKLIF